MYGRKSPERTAPGWETLPAEIPYYHYTQSQLFLRIGDIKKATDSLRMAVVNDPDSVFLKSELAQIYILQKRYKEAIVVLQAALKKHHDNIMVLTMLAGVYETLRE